MDLDRGFNKKVPSEAFDDKTLETVFKIEKEKWKTKMDKVFDDSYPYDFLVAYGHSDEDRTAVDDSMKLHDENSMKESMKIEPFVRLEEMDAMDMRMEKEFHELLASMENEVATSSSLNDLLLQRKKECDEVFYQFDEIVALCEEFFDLEYKDCQNRAKKQSDMQKELLHELERYLTQVADAGEREISTLKDNISGYIREVGLLWSDKIEESLKETENQPSRMETFSECVEAITASDVRETFLLDQQETSRLWKKAFEDLMMLSAELNRYRCNYNMTKSNLERAIYWMDRNYRDNLPKLTRTQRQIGQLVDRTSDLTKELDNTEEQIEKERREQQKAKLNYYNKIASLHTSNKLAYERATSRNKIILEIKKSEITDLLKTLLIGDRKIYEETLEMPWNAADLSLLESKGKKQSTSKSVVQAPSHQSMKTLHDDDFADAFLELVCCGNFEILLNHIADELGYMLDFEWVDYAKQTLELKNEIKWLELFKVFKIDFAKDLKDLKKHMMKFCKNDGPEASFDTSRALDGFLQFVHLKNQTTKESDLNLKNIETHIDQEFWEFVDKVTPNVLLWDSVLGLLKNYRVMLESRQRYMATRSELAKENEELDVYLENYKSH